MWVISVWRSTCRTKARFLLTDAVPTPHANLIAAFAGKEIQVGYIEFFAAERANVI
jgi:hypothetical protein